MEDKDFTPTDDLTQGVPGFLFVDHIAIAVPSGQLEAQLEIYRMMGIYEFHREIMTGQDQVREVLLRIGQGPNLLQLLEPLSPQSPVQKAIERNSGKGGLNHVGFRVRDIHRAFRYFQDQGFHLLDDAPRRGSRGSTVFFVHPKTLPGHALNVLVEVVQE